MSQRDSRSGSVAELERSEPTQDVLVPHQDRLVDLRLPEPAGLLPGEEHLDGHLLPPPAAQPHLAVAALPDLTNHLDLLGDGPLDLEEDEKDGRVFKKKIQDDSRPSSGALK